MMLEMFKKNQTVSFLSLLILGAVVFANALGHPNIMDDHVFFEDTAINPGQLWVYFIPDKAKHLHWVQDSPEIQYRPLAMIVPRLLYWCFHRNGFAVQAVDLLLWVLAAWLLLRLLNGLCANFWFGYLCAALMLVHPLNGIVINLKTAGIFALQMACMLACSRLMLLYPQSPRRDIAAGVLFLSAFFCHESTFFLPVCLTITAMIIQKNGFKAAWKRLNLLWIVAGVYFILRLFHSSFYPFLFDSGKLAAYRMGPLEALASWVELQAWYFPKLFYPDGVVISAFKPVVREGVWGWIIPGLLCWAAAGWASVQFFRDRVWFQMGLCWLIVLAVMMLIGSLFQGGLLYIEPHWFIFSSIGCWVMTADMLVWFFEKGYQKTVIIIAAALVLYFGVFSWQYNRLWADELAYCRYWQSHNPFYAPINAHIARIYYSRGQYELAADYYQKALVNQQSDHVIYGNLGTIALLKKDFSAANAYLRRALDMEPKDHHALNSLGVLNAQQGDFSGAEECFRRVLDINPADPEAARNLAYLRRLMSRR